MLAESIYEAFGDKEWTKKVYENAETKAEHFSDFLNIADGITEKLADKEWANGYCGSAQPGLDLYSPHTLAISRQAAIISGQDSAFS